MYRDSLDRKYFQHNYIDVVAKFVPQVYFEEEELLYGKEENIIYTMINRVAAFASEFNSNIVTLESDYTAKEISSFFTNNHNKTSVDASLIQKILLDPLGELLVDQGFPSLLSEFESVSDLRQALVSIILPHLFPGNTSNEMKNNLNSQLGMALSSEQEWQTFFLNNLGLLFPLASPGNHDAALAPASLRPYHTFIELIVNVYENGITIDTGDCVKGFYNYLWINTDNILSFNSYIPSILNKRNATADGLEQDSQTSGVQHLERINTYIDIIYNSNDKSSRVLADSIHTLNEGGYLEITEEAAGPFIKFLKGMGCSFHDIKSTVDGIGDLLDIDQCPREFFEYLARYLGWALQGSDFTHWKAQLRQAIYVYKSKGTRKALAGALNSLFTIDHFNVDRDLIECWESYIPNMLYYILKTESPIFEDELSGERAILCETFLKDGIQALLPDYFRIPKTFDKQLRTAVDYLLARVHQDTKFMMYGNQPWEFQKVHDLGRDTIVPPFERDNYYRYFEVTKPQLQSLKKWLTAPICSGGFGVDADTIEFMFDYVRGAAMYLEDGFGTLGVGKKRWKFLVSDFQYPTNRAESIKKGEVASLDYWCSKSSEIFVMLEVDAFHYMPADPTSRAWGEDAVEVLSKTLQEFIPFHLHLNLHFYKEMEEKYPIPPYCFFAVIYPTRTFEHNKSLLTNPKVGGFNLASGTGEIFNNNIGHGIDFPLKEMYKEHQSMPPVSSTVWRGITDYTDTMISNTDVERKSIRRKSLYQATPTDNLHYRDGKAQPAPLQFLSASSILPPHADFMYTPQFLMKGYLPSEERYAPSYLQRKPANGFVTTVNVDPVWDASVGDVLGDTHYGVEVRDFFPIRNSTTLCASALQYRDGMTPGTFELWKLKDSLETSENLIRNGDFADEWEDDWVDISEEEGSIERVNLQDIVALKLNSKHWPTASLSTSYPHVAGVEQTLTGLKPFTEYKVSYKTKLNPLDSLDGYNNGVIATVKNEAEEGSTLHWNFSYDKEDTNAPSEGVWMNYNQNKANKLKFCPSWGNNKPESDILDNSFTFVTFDHPHNIKLQFWGGGSLTASAVNTTLTSEYDELDHSLFCDTYITDVSVTEVKESNFNLEGLDLGEGVARLWHEYNRCNKAMNSDTFDGGSTLVSHIAGPHLKGGYLGTTWDTSNIEILTGVTKDYPGAEPILGEEFLPSYGFETSAGWTASSKVILSSLDFDDTLNSMFYTQNSGFEGNDCYTEGNFEVGRRPCVLSFYWSASGMAGTTSGSPTVRLHNETKNYDYSFNLAKWIPNIDTINDKEYWRIGTEDIAALPTNASFSDMGWHYFETVIYADSNFQLSDNYKLYIAAEAEAQIYNSVAAFTLVSLKPILGWRTSELFDNTHFDVFPEKAHDNSVFFNFGDKLNADPTDGTSFSFITDGGVDTVNMIKHIGPEEFFKDSMRIDLDSWDLVNARVVNNIKFSGFGAYPSLSRNPEDITFLNSFGTHWDNNIIEMDYSGEGTTKVTSKPFNLRINTPIAFSIAALELNSVATTNPLRFTLRNKRSGKYFDFSTSTFVSSPSYCSSFIDGTVSTGVWGEIYAVFNSSLFKESDDFEVEVTLDSLLADSSNKKCYLGPIKVTSLTNNNLEPDANYTISISNRNNSFNEEVGVAIRTEDIDGVSWYFDFTRQRWEARKTGDRDFPFHTFKVGYTAYYQESSIYFNTFNGRRNVPSFASQWEHRNGPICTRDRTYEVIVFRNTKQQRSNINTIVNPDDPYVDSNCFETIRLNTLVSVGYVSIINEDNKSFYYDKNNITTYKGLGHIYKDIFDVYGEDFLSRDASLSQFSYNGGARSLYLDSYGFDYDHAATKYGQMDANGSTETILGNNSNSYEFEE